MCTPREPEPCSSSCHNPSGGAGRAQEETTPLYLPCAGEAEGGQGGIMEGRYPHGLLLAITNCTDPMVIHGRRGDRSPWTDTYTNGDTSLIIHANDAFPISPAPNLNPTAPCTGINTDNRLKEMRWVQTTWH